MSEILFALSGSPQSGEGGNPLMMFVPIILIFVVFYLILIRPQQKKQKEHQNLLSQLRKGDKVVTNGGLYGTIVDAKDHVAVIKIAENVKVEIVKSAIATVIERKGDQ
ncbi:MAG: preprotein translocase subunit YajC [Candidatus Krumholzibacteriota bacterium]|nr:preprotein translocase subunit YajC [Candidatus Krumholzibacteriota bacterium]